MKPTSIRLTDQSEKQLETLLNYYKNNSPVLRNTTKSDVINTAIDFLYCDIYGFNNSTDGKEETRTDGFWLDEE